MVNLQASEVNSNTQHNASALNDLYLLTLLYLAGWDEIYDCSV